VRPNEMMRVFGVAAFELIREDHSPALMWLTKCWILNPMALVVAKWA